MSQGEQGSLSVKDHHPRELPSGVTQGRGQCSEGGGAGWREHREVAMTVGFKPTLPLMSCAALLSPSLSASPSGKNKRPLLRILRNVEDVRH